MNASLVLAVCGLLSTGQLMAPSKQRALLATLPKLDNKEFDESIRSSRVIWYTSKEMPPAYQKDGTFHSPSYNISADPSDNWKPHGKGGNANVEFPWNLAPGGANASKSVTSFKGLLLPLDRPIVWWRQSLPPGVAARNYGYRWIYPVGTIFIEALSMRAEGSDHVFEVRFRIRESDAWGVEIFRPFATASALAAALEDVGGYSAAVAKLRAPAKKRLIRLVDRSHRTKLAFDVTANTEELPALGGDLALQLLRREFTSSLGVNWKDDVVAPSNESGYLNIIPSKYKGSHVGNDRTGCLKCHESTNRPATDFDRNRGWYGRVRGSDGILSFHPIALSSISYNGSDIPVRMRRKLVDAGVVRQFNPRVHSSKDYRLIKGLY